MMECLPAHLPGLFFFAAPHQLNVTVHPKLATTWFSRGILVLNQVLVFALAILRLDTDPKELKLKVISSIFSNHYLGTTKIQQRWFVS